VSDGRDDEGPVEVPVEALAGALGDEETPVAGGTFEVPLGRILLGGMRSADGVVRAESTHFEGELKVLSELSSLLDKASEGAFGSSTSRRKEDGGHGDFGDRPRAVDAFAERARGIAALEGYRRDEKMSQGMEEIEANPGKVRLVLDSFHPGVVAAEKLPTSRQNGRAILPIADRLLVEPEEDPFPPNLARGGPSRS